MSQLHPKTHVWEYSGLPDHNPVVVSFHIPCHYGKIRQWKLPRSLNTNQCSHIKANLSACSPVDDGEITLDNWSTYVEVAWSQILQSSNLKVRTNQRGRGQTLVTKNIPPVRSPRNPHDWDLSKVKILRGENAFSVLYKIKLRQNRRLQHLKCLYSQMDRRHSKQYEDEIDR